MEILTWMKRSLSTKFPIKIYEIAATLLSKLNEATERNQIIQAITGKLYTVWIYALQSLSCLPYRQ